MNRFFLIFLLAVGMSAHGQTQKPKPKPAPTENSLPKVAVTIAGYKGGDVTGDILSKIVDSALVVRDSKGNTYQLVRFRVLYKFKSTYDDPETGQKKNFDDMRTNDFSNTAVMSELWRQSIKDNVKPGDEMIVDNIIIRLKNGTKLMAPRVAFKVI